MELGQQRAVQPFSLTHCHIPLYRGKMPGMEFLLSPATYQVGQHNIHQSSFQDANQDLTPRCLPNPSIHPWDWGAHSPWALLERDMAKTAKQPEIWDVPLRNGERSREAVRQSRYRFAVTKGFFFFLFSFFVRRNKGETEERLFNL